MRRTIAQRKRFFVAVEGESEQSFVAWLQTLASEQNLAVHLDTIVLGGGGFRSMLGNAVREHKRRSNTKGGYRLRFLMVDQDRSEHGDWSVEKLRAEAAVHEIVVCLQRPNHEGLLYRMLPGHEREFVSAHSAHAKLKSQWQTYEKPVNAQKLKNKYTLTDLLRMAKCDGELATLLAAVGFETQIGHK